MLGSNPRLYFRLKGVGARHLHQLGEAEIHHLRLPVLGHEDVGRFHVTMDDSTQVRGGERIGHLDRELEKLADLERSSRQVVGQGSSLQTFQ
ncbi:MAG TPA: hypothetical protein VGC53_09105 [Vicinamibacteria bacterium]|jgi:hypothetical protein